VTVALLAVLQSMISAVIMSRDCNHTAVSEYSEESAAIFGNGHQMVKNKV
jgi:hypothetical protein